MSETELVTNEGDFAVRLDSMIADAGHVAVRTYQLKIMSVLYQIDGSFAGIANELTKNHCPEYLWTVFSESWDALKVMIHEIEFFGKDQSHE